MFPYGAGGQKVLDFLSSQINPPKIVLVDESQKKFTPKRIHDTVEDFFEDKEKRILIGTIRTLKALEDKKLENVVMVSAGNLVKGKSFDSDERLMSLISSLENISENLYINRRSGDEISLDQYKNREKFLEEEVIARKSANLPPFGKVVTLTFNYKQKRGLDKFLMKDLEIQKTGEERKGQTYTYYWVVKENILEKNSQLFKYLRNFGDLTVSDTIYTSSVLGKK
jgi:primosomal protein N'